MFLAIDIGNTTTAFGLLKNNKIIGVVRMDTAGNQRQLKNNLTQMLRVLVKKYGGPKRVVICSVVPKALVVIEPLVNRFFNVNALVVGRDVSVPMANRYRNPKQVGQDRLIGAYAAMMLYGLPAIVIDLGTAITFDAVSAQGEYLGGVIVPGLRLSVESLFLKTALLPNIAIKAPRSIIGKDTEESILSGIFYGYGSLCRGLIELISKQLKSKPKVIMTGGHTHLMKKFISPEIRIIDEHLVFKGMNLLDKNF